MSVSERRKTILEAASRLFEHYGYAKTTMADVAREAQIGVGTVYLEFESKEAIVGELSLSTHSGVLESMQRAARWQPDPCARLVEVMIARTECFLALRRKGQHACELVHCSKADGVRSANEQFRKDEHSFLSRLLSDGCAAGLFAGVEDPDSTAGLLQRAFVTLSPLSPSWPSADEREILATARAMAELLLRGVVGPAVTAPSNKRSPGGPVRARRSRA